MCDCRTAINEKLEPFNTRLAFGFAMTDKGMDLAPLMIETEKIDKTKRSKSPAVLASFCPFCGTKLSSQDL